MPPPPSPSTPSSPQPLLTTPLTTLLSITHPVLLAGMAHTSTAPLAAAVTLAGGLGTIGGLGYTPAQLRAMIQDLKARLHTTGPATSTAAFGVDLALPALGGTARKTNHDYTSGQLAGLIDVIVEEKATLFVSAVGVPPAWAIEKLHKGGVVVMNMVGHPRHARKAFQAGVDIVCAQGGEGGGHTGEVPMGLLVPACLDEAGRWRPSTLQQKMRMEEGQTGMVVAAGGIWDGRGLAAALAMGAVGVWVGTRFVASVEAGCSEAHKRAVVDAGWEDTMRTLVVSGRPLRVKRNEYVRRWEDGERGEGVRELTERGVVPMEKDLEDEDDNGEEVDMPFLMGQVAAVIDQVLPAAVIVENMTKEAAELLRRGGTMVNQVRPSKL